MVFGSLLVFISLLLSSFHSPDAVLRSNGRPCAGYVIQASSPCPGDGYYIDHVHTYHREGRTNVLDIRIDSRRIINVDVVMSNDGSRVYDIQAHGRIAVNMVAFDGYRSGGTAGKTYYPVCVIIADVISQNGWLSGGMDLNAGVVYPDIVGDDARLGITYHIDANSASRRLSASDNVVIDGWLRGLPHGPNKVDAIVVIRQNLIIADGGRGICTPDASRAISFDLVGDDPGVRIPSVAVDAPSGAVYDLIFLDPGLSQVGDQYPIPHTVSDYVVCDGGTSART